MSHHTGSQKIVSDWIKANGTMSNGKQMPKLKMARIIYNENPLLFSSVEKCRKTIQIVTGKCGDRLRGKGMVKDQSLFESEKLSTSWTNPYNLPESDEAVYEPFVIKGKKILVLSDVHIPYHNIPALSAAIGWAESKEPDTILLNGDTIDFFQLSRFCKEPGRRSFSDELTSFKDFISALRNVFPKARIVFKEGNHEERYNAFLYQKANELVGVSEFTLENIIKTRAEDIDYIGKKRIIKAGSLNIIHGHEFAGGIFSPVNIARGLFLKAKVSCMQGHNHQTSEHTESNMNEQITTTWSLGCLCELHPEYMPLNKWNHGFAFIEVDKDGSFQVQNKRINKGEVL